MTEPMFEFAEPSTGCPHCGRPTPGDVCLWCNPPRVAATPSRVMARRSDPSTSKRAAEKARYRTGSHKALILLAHGRNRGGLTDEESAPASGLTYHQAERRCCDLRNEGMLTILTDADGREVERQGTSGSWMRVSVLTDLGIATLTSMKEPDDGLRTTPVPVPTSPPDSTGPCDICGQHNGQHQHQCPEYDPFGHGPTR